VHLKRENFGSEPDTNWCRAFLLWEALMPTFENCTKPLFLIEPGRSGFCGLIRDLHDAPNNPTQPFEEANLLGCSHA